MKHLALMIPVFTTLTIACDDTQESFDNAHEMHTARTIEVESLAAAAHATYVTRAVSLVDIASRAARLQVEAIQTLEDFGCDISIPTALSSVDGACEEVGDDAFVLDITDCETDTGDRFDMTISVGGEDIEAAFALAKSTGMPASDFLRFRTERALDIVIDTGRNYQIESCGVAGERGLRAIATQSIELTNPDGDYVTYSASSVRNGAFTTRAVQNATLELIDASQPAQEASNIEFSIGGTGTMSLMPEAGVAHFSGKNAHRVMFRRHLTKKNTVVYQSDRNRILVGVPEL